MHRQTANTPLVHEIARAGWMMTTYTQSPRVGLYGLFDTCDLRGMVLLIEALLAPKVMPVIICGYFDVQRQITT